jgi:NitT/TauT family transport system substrate-binding protein
MKKKRILLFLCIALVMALTACGGDDQKADEGAPIDTKVATWKTAQTITPFFYEDFLGEEDKVEVMPFTNPGDMKSALMAGSVDMCGTTLVTAITAASKGEPIKILTGLSNKCSALVVGVDSDIKEAKDLMGKRIAYVPGTMHHLLLLETLSGAGLDPDKDVTLVRIDFFDMGQALAQGEIDAFYSGEPYPSIAVAEGYGRVLLYPDDKDGFGIINSCMITTEDMIKNDPEKIQKLVTSHAMATEFLNEDKEAWINKSVEFGTEKEVMEVSVENIEMFWEIDETYIQSVEKLAERMLEQGLITEIPDIEAMFDLSFQEEAKNAIK